MAGGWKGVGRIGGRSLVERENVRPRSTSELDFFREYGVESNVKERAE